MPNSTVRAQYGEKREPEERSVESWGGIVSARVEDLARELGTTPEAIAQAVEEGDAEPLLDTTEPKGRGKDRERPTDPALRSLAFVEEELEALREAVDGEGNPQGGPP